MAEGEVAQRVAAVRRFNRFYTQHIGVLEEGWASSSFSLTEARVLYELTYRRDATATALARDLRLDPGYLSRILQGFESRGLISRAASEADARRQLLALTARGRTAFAPLETHATQAVEATLSRLPGAEQDRLIGSMRRIERLLGGEPESGAPYVLRPHRPGDMGWIVWAHGVVYAEEYGWDGHEALVADIVSSFIKTFDPQRERCWIAEQDGENVGSVMLVRSSAATAQLRAMLVMPAARGLGVGAHLVEECVRFARAAGYRKIRLWTQSILVGARHLYARAGFRLVKAEPHASFGKELTAETWELKL